MQGVLPSGRTVAVKQLFERYDILDKNFESEVTCLAGVKHKNTVRFLGYCSETQQVLMPYDGKRVLADVRHRLLCFEYMPRGCLADYYTVLVNQISLRAFLAFLLYSTSKCLPTPVQSIYFF